LITRVAIRCLSLLKKYIFGETVHC
jgi:hypothetical protein